MSSPDWYPPTPVRSILDNRVETVLAAQLILRVPQTGRMDTATISAIRGVQLLFNLPITGNLDSETAKALDSLRWVDTDSIQESGSAP